MVNSQIFAQIEDDLKVFFNEENLNTDGSLTNVQNVK